LFTIILSMMRVFGNRRGYLKVGANMKIFYIWLSFIFKLILYIVILWEILTCFVSLETQYFLSNRSPAYNYEKDYK
jgi:hypothetical protein